MIIKLQLLVLIVFLTAAIGVAAPLSTVDSRLQRYKAANLGEISLDSVGSDSMQELVDAWVEAYKEYHRGIAINVLSKGSASAAAALIDGRADIGPMVRPMKSPELDEFRLKYGFEPTLIRTALAGVAVYVSSDNPLKSISFEQLDGIFSKDLRRSGAHRISNWKGLGVEAKNLPQKIMPLSFTDTSYPYAFFRQQVLVQGDFHSEVTAISDTNGLLEAIRANPNAIAFGPILSQEELIPAVSLLPVSRFEGEEAYLPSLENLLAEKYPLGRFFNVYLVRSPGEEFDLAAKDFLKFALSREGQQIVQNKGLIPLPYAIVQEELGKLN